MSKDKLQSIRRLLTMLHAEYHNPDVSRRIDPKFDVEYEFVVAIRRLDHELAQ
jgi:hypothetical protein